MINPVTQARLNNLRKIVELVKDKEVMDRFELRGLIKFMFGVSDRIAKEYITTLVQAGKFKQQGEKIIYWEVDKK